MTHDTTRDAQVTAWLQDTLKRLGDAQRRSAEEARARAERPPPFRRQRPGVVRFRPAGPADAATQARLSKEARRLDAARQAALLSMMRTVIEIAAMTPPRVDD